MTTLWDTTGGEVIKALAAQRHTGGGMTSGLALTLVVVVDEKQVGEAESAAATAAAAHPCRLLLVIRREVEAPVPRLDAEVLLGGRLGPGEAVVMRMYGRLGLHAESVTLPLLAPDVPVVTWWDGAPPEQIAYDPLGVFADRRITDASRGADPAATLAERAADYAAGDTDLSWTRITPWRSALAAAADSATVPITGAAVFGAPEHPSAQLLAGWLGNRLHSSVSITPDGTTVDGIARVELTFDEGEPIRLSAPKNGLATLERGGLGTSSVPMATRDLGELLAEELHRLDPDVPYAEALGTAIGTGRLDERPDSRVHVWRDPAA